MKKFSKILIWTIVILGLLYCVLTPIITYASIYYKNFATVNFNARTYSTIEELHEDFAQTNANQPSATVYLDDIAFTLTVDRNVFVFCKYSRNPARSVIEPDLIFYGAMTTEQNTYVLPMTLSGSIFTYRLPLHDDYQSEEYTKMLPNIPCPDGPMARYAAFAYKEKDSTDVLYNNGVKMQEVIKINPFTGEEFLLCYSHPQEPKNALKQFWVFTFQKTKMIPALTVEQK